MKAMELVNKLNEINQKYGDVEVMISNHRDADSNDFQNEVFCVLYEDYNNNKVARIFYEEE